MRSALWVMLALGLPALALAQDDEGSAEAEAVEQFEPLEVPRGAQASDSESAQAADAPPEEDAAPAAEAGGPPKWWVGAFFQGVIVPDFFLKAFLDEAPTVANIAVGATVSNRNPDGFTWVLGLGYTGYGFDGPFRITGDPEMDTEYLNSTLGLVHVRGQLLWTAQLSNALSFEYGVGLDLGLVVGEMRRSEAYPLPDGGYAKCEAPGVPDLVYCEPTVNNVPTNGYDEEGAHYDVVEERVPPIAGSIMLPVLGLRFTPARQVSIRLEVAYQILQFSFGITAAYGLDV